MSCSCSVEYDSIRCDAWCGPEQTIVEADLRKELELANPGHLPTEIILVGAGASAGMKAAYAFVEYGEVETPTATGGDAKRCAEIAAETIASVCLRLPLLCSAKSASPE